MVSLNSVSRDMSACESLTTAVKPFSERSRSAIGRASLARLSLRERRDSPISGDNHIIAHSVTPRGYSTRDHVIVFIGL